MSARRLVVVGAVAISLLAGACGSHDPARTVAVPSPAAVGVLDLSAQAPASLAVVTGDANSPVPAAISPTLASLLTRAVKRSAGLAVVDAGGRPRLYSTTLGTDANNADAIQSAQAAQLAGLPSVLSRVTPAEPESDPWAAFVTAVGWVKGHGGGTVVIANSGLGTTGFLDYRQKGLLAASPSELVAFARTHHELPDASGVGVLLLGIGWTAAPQPALAAPERGNLVTQWQQLVEAAGANVEVDPTPLTGPGPKAAPHVTTVSITETAWQPAPGTCGTAFDANTVHFEVGTAILVDPASAAGALRHVVATLERLHQTATVTGTTSSEGGDAINIPLSQARAATIASLMRQLGLPPGQIGHVVGLGSHFPGFVPDTGPDGALLPGPAAENRQTIISWPCNQSASAVPN